MRERTGAAQLTVTIYCLNDLSLLALIPGNTLNITARNDFERLFYEAPCKTTPRQNPVRRTRLRDRRSRHHRDRCRYCQEASHRARPPAQGRLMTDMLSQQMIELMDAVLLAMPLLALFLLAGWIWRSR